MTPFGARDHNLTSGQTWRDAGGVFHDDAHGPHRRRIVSLVPSLTETLCDLGARDRLVGCTAFCIRPAGLLKDPAVTLIGGTKTIQRERLLALKPDLILANLEENTRDDIDFLSSRVECYINGTETVDDGIRTIREVGALVGAEARAEELAAPAESLLRRIRERAAELSAARGGPWRVAYFVWRDPWMTVRGDTFISHHLQACGAFNVFASVGQTRYPEVPWDALRAAAPDRIWLPSEPYHFKAADAADAKRLAGAAAPEPELVDGDGVCWFGTRQLEGMAATFRALWGEAP